MTQKTFNAVLSGGEVIEFPRLHVQTRFYEGEDEGLGGPTVREAQARAEENRKLDNFIEANKAQAFAFDSRVDTLAVDRYNTKNYYIMTAARVLGYSWMDSVRTLNKADRAAIEAAIEAQKADIEKRARTWFKRYGADKIICDTYWMSA